MMMYILSSCKTRKRLSLVTLLRPAARISLFPRRHKTVSFEYGPIITHVNKASLPSVTTVGPPVPSKCNQKQFNKIITVSYDFRVV